MNNNYYYSETILTTQLNPSRHHPTCNSATAKLSSLECPQSWGVFQHPRSMRASPVEGTNKDWKEQGGCYPACLPLVHPFRIEITGGQSVDSAAPLRGTNKHSATVFTKNPDLPNILPISDSMQIPR